MNAERTPLPRDVAAYHAAGRCCARCAAYWGPVPRPPWWRRLWRALFFLAAVGMAPALVEAIPHTGCWALTPQDTEPGYHGATFEVMDCGGRNSFILSGADSTGPVYLELSATVIGLVGGPGPLSLTPPQWEHFYLRMLFPVGPVFMPDPDVYMAQWLMGSDVGPESSRRQHDEGLWRWPWETSPPALDPVPEPTSLLLLGSGLALIGWRVWRGR